MRSTFWMVALLGMLSMAGCGPVPAVTSQSPSSTPALSATVVTTATTFAITSQPTAGASVAQPGASSTPTPAADDISADRYLDDRSDGGQLVRSLYNAINRKEYVRAYSYWEPDAEQLAPFEQFQQGYANTESVDLVVGEVFVGAAAGNIYADVPVVLVAHHADLSTETFTGCYTMHMGNPALQAQPPFQPLGIRSASVKPAPDDADMKRLLAQACPQR